ncbi:MAG: ABC transporter substrate-binding protein, partial [Acidimicrobiia bacterium]
PGVPASPEILLGAFGTKTGPIGAQVVSAEVAIRAWVADVNSRGGLAGHPVRVIVYDDGGDPGRALAAVRRMVEEDKVLALYGSFGAATTHAVAPYLEEKGVPMVGGVPAPVADTSPMIFNPETGGTKGTARSYLATIKTLSDKTRVGFFYCREADTCTEAAEEVRAYAPRLGLSVVYMAAVSLAQPDYTAEVLAARNAGAEVLSLSLDLASYTRVAAAAHRQGWQPVISGASQVHQDVGGAADELEGLLGAATVVPYTTSARMRPYLEAVARYVPGGALGEYGAANWVGGKLWERLAATFGSGPVTRGQVLDALYGLRDETLGDLVPPLTFPKGAHIDVNLCTYPIQLRAGRWTSPRGDQPVCAPD